MRSTIVPIAVVLTLGGCAFPKATPLDNVPDDVLAAVPSDIDLSELNKDPDGCYFYVYAADLFVVRDRAGQPICIPE